MVLTCRSMITKNFVKNTAAWRELFFSEDLPQGDLERYQAMLRENESPVPVIDVSHSSSPRHLPTSSFCLLTLLSAHAA